MLTLSQGGIATFLTCQRKFQLRYLTHKNWPELPLPPELKARLQEGTLFHQLVALHYSGTPTVEEKVLGLQKPLSDWWANFKAHAPAQPDADLLYSEKSLRLPIHEDMTLFGRVDLMRLTPAGIFLYDWKTGNPRPRSQLVEDFQTRLYLFLVYELRDQLGRPALMPEEVSITYWYAGDPAKSVFIRYGQAWHARNRSELLDVIGELSTLLSQSDLSSKTVWPLTPNEARCAQCQFAHRCGRAFTRETAQLESEHEAEDLYSSQIGEDPERLDLRADQMLGDELDAA